MKGGNGGDSMSKLSMGKVLSPFPRPCSDNPDNELIFSFSHSFCALSQNQLRLLPSCFFKFLMPLRCKWYNPHHGRARVANITYLHSLSPTWRESGPPGPCCKTFNKSCLGFSLTQSWFCNAANIFIILILLYSAILKVILFFQYLLIFFISIL